MYYSTYIILKQSLEKVTAYMLIVKIVIEKNEDFWTADVYIAILQKKKSYNNNNISKNNDADS